MASSIEITFGSKLIHAKTMDTIVPTFVPVYQPLAPMGELPLFSALIITIETNNTNSASSKSNKSLAVENRQRLFDGDATSLAKRLTLITGYIAARFGKDSKQMHDIMFIIRKIRGFKPAKPKKEEDGKTHSDANTSFGSVTLDLADLLAIFTSYGTDYAPTNALVTIASLTTLLDDINAASRAVDTADAQLKPFLDTRAKNYDELHLRAQAIKDTTKSQYGAQSIEYKQIKGLKI